MQQKNRRLKQVSEGQGRTEGSSRRTRQKIRSKQRNETENRKIRTQEKKSNRRMVQRENRIIKQINRAEIEPKATLSTGDKLMGRTKVSPGKALCAVGKKGHSTLQLGCSSSLHRKYQNYGNGWNNDSRV